MKLQEFRLESYDERSLLQSALDVLRPRLAAYVKDTNANRFDKERLATCEALALRLSQTECQPGGCEYCNADRAREASEQWED